MKAIIQKQNIIRSELFVTSPSYMKFVFVISLFVFFTRCSKVNNTEIEDSTNMKLDTQYLEKDSSANSRDTYSGENFEAFYLRFNADLDFQNSRIAYPLDGENFDGTSDETKSIRYNWTLKDSLDFNNFKLDTAIYKTDRQVSENLVIEKIYIPNSGFKIESHFKLINGKWFLVWFSSIIA